MKASFDHPTSTKAWGDLALLISRSYWRRLWIQQEIATEKNVTVHCGHFSLPLTQLYYTVNAVYIYLFMHGWDDLSVFKREVRLRVSKLHHPELRGTLDRKDYRTLLELVLFQSLMRATDPKDKVYGIVGICHPWRENLTIDYQLPTHRVYVRAFKSFVIWYNHLDLMVDSIRPQAMSCLEYLPSWCPDFSINISWPDGADRHELPHTHHPKDFPTRSRGYWGTSQLDFHFKCSDNVLVAGGLILDAVETSSAGFGPYYSDVKEENIESMKGAVQLGMGFRGGPYWSFWQSPDATRAYSDREKYTVASDLIQTYGMFNLFSTQDKTGVKLVARISSAAHS